MKVLIERAHEIPVGKIMDCEYITLFNEPLARLYWQARDAILPHKVGFSNKEMYKVNDYTVQTALAFLYEGYNYQPYLQLVSELLAIDKANGGWTINEEIRTCNKNVETVAELFQRLKRNSPHAEQGNCHLVSTYDEAFIKYNIMIHENRDSYSLLVLNRVLNK